MIFTTKSRTTPTLRRKDQPQFKPEKANPHPEKEVQPQPERRKPKRRKGQSPFPRVGRVYLSNCNHEPSDPPLWGRVRPHPSFTLEPGLAIHFRIGPGPSPSFPFGWAPWPSHSPLFGWAWPFPLLGRAWPTPTPRRKDQPNRKGQPQTGKGRGNPCSKNCQPLPKRGEGQNQT